MVGSWKMIYLLSGWPILRGDIVSFKGGLQGCLWECWFLVKGYVQDNAPWKFNMEPANDGLEDDVPFQLGDFWVPCESSGV